MKKVPILATILALNGCATIVNDPTIPLTASFSDGSAGECNFRNKRGAWSSAMPTSNAMIRRSDDALIYDCTTADGRRSNGSIRSEMEGGKLAASVFFWDLGITDSITDKHRTYQGNVVIPVRPREPVAGTAVDSQTFGSSQQYRNSHSGPDRIERGYQ
jgi:hypothetical protein